MKKGVYGLFKLLNISYKKNMNLDNNSELENIYKNVKLIDLNNLLNKSDINILNKLGYKINGKYSEKEFEKMLNELIIDYYINPKRINSSDDLPRKNLEETNITREKYNELIAKLDKIDSEVVSNISITELNKRQEIRRKTINVLIKSIIKYDDKDLFPYNQLAEILNLSQYGKKSLKEDISNIKKSINKDKKIMELIKKYSI